MKGPFTETRKTFFIEVDTQNRWTISENSLLGLCNAYETALKDIVELKEENTRLERENRWIEKLSIWLRTADKKIKEMQK